MTIATNRSLSFEEYLALDPSDLPEGRFEYVDGELVAVMPESGFNDAIANYLFILLVNAGIYYELIRPHSCEVEVPGKPRTRLPDLVILDAGHLPLIERRNTITSEMPPPPLIVEVVSPGAKNRERDFTAKRQQYAARGIPEYWLIDPEQQCLTILRLATPGHYTEVGIFRGAERITSPTFPQLPLTAAQILTAGRSDDMCAKARC